MLPQALAPNMGAQLAFRFLAALFASTPLTCAGGSIADLWNPLERFYAFPIFSNAAFMGPVVVSPPRFHVSCADRAFKGPVIGGYIAQSSVIGWRWVEWTTLIFSGVTLVLVTGESLQRNLRP